LTPVLPDRLSERLFKGRVAGVDEVGRGPLCGPVVAAAVILPGSPRVLRPTVFDGIRDSKAISPRKREKMAEVIRSQCVIGVGVVEAWEIDAMGILQATFLAMRKSIDALPEIPDHVLIDGNMVPQGLSCPASAIVKGDATCLAIAAASIIAKCHRDAIMAELALSHPQYGWERNSGYGTREHRFALREYGPTRHHRRSFHWGIDDEPVQQELFA